MSLMWMPPQITRPPFFTACSACGTSAPTGAKRIAASGGSGCAPRDLREDVCGSAEAVQAYGSRVFALRITAIADQSGAKKRRRFGVAIALGNRKAEAL